MTTQSSRVLPEQLIGKKRQQDSSFMSISLSDDSDCGSEDTLMSDASSVLSTDTLAQHVPPQKKPRLDEAPLTVHDIIDKKSFFPHMSGSSTLSQIEFTHQSIKAAGLSSAPPSGHALPSAPLATQTGFAMASSVPVLNLAAASPARPPSSQQQDIAPVTPSTGTNKKVSRSCSKSIRSQARSHIMASDPASAAATPKAKQRLQDKFARQDVQTPSRLQMANKQRAIAVGMSSHLTTSMGLVQSHIKNFLGDKNRNNLEKELRSSQAVINTSCADVAAAFDISGREIITPSPEQKQEILAICNICNIFRKEVSVIVSDMDRNRHLDVAYPWGDKLSVFSKLQSNLSTALIVGEMQKLQTQFLHFQHEERVEKQQELDGVSNEITTLTTNIATCESRIAAMHQDGTSSGSQLDESMKRTYLQQIETQKNRLAVLLAKKCHLQTIVDDLYDKFIYVVQLVRHHITLCSKQLAQGAATLKEGIDENMWIHSTHVSTIASFQKVIGSLLEDQSAVLSSHYREQLLRLSQDQPVIYNGAKMEEAWRVMKDSVVHLECVNGLCSREEESAVERYEDSFDQSGVEKYAVQMDQDVRDIIALSMSIKLQ